ncbi:MAG: CotH kinase family protein [Nitriliruptoraceae bacterium]|nr:CotH kinase family protein [Nitriliruptoraceae bacterium]
MLGLIAAVVVGLTLTGCAALDDWGSSSASGAQEIADSDDPTSSAPGDDRVSEEAPAMGPVEVIELHLELDESDLEDLYARDPFSDDRLPGRFRVGDGVWRDLRDPGIRFRGNSSRRAAKKSFNVRFDDVVEEFGADRINLNASFTDPSLMREHLAYRMFHELGRPAPRTGFVALYIQGNYEGLYTYVQRVDDQLLEEQGIDPVGSTLVRDRTRQRIPDSWSMFGSDISGLPDEGQMEAWLADRVDVREEADWSRLADLVRWVAETPSGVDFDDGLDRFFHVEEFIDWIAVHELIADVDSYGDDYWLYIDGADPERRFGIIPWDMDLSFGSHYIAGQGLGGTRQHAFRYEWPLISQGRSFVQENELVEKAMQSPRTSEAVEARILELIEGELAPERVNDWIEDTESAIRELAVRRGTQDFELHGSNHHGEDGNRDLHVDSLRDFLTLRAAFLQAHLNGGSDVIDAARVEVDGVQDQIHELLDGEGWTLARVQVHDPGDATSVSLALEPGGSETVDRTWLFRHDGSGAVDATIDLYYRNLPEQCGLPRCENWFRPDEPVAFSGDQHRLIVRAEAPLAIDNLGANPYSNRVRARIELPPESRLQLTVTDR